MAPTVAVATRRSLRLSGGKKKGDLVFHPELRVYGKIGLGKLFALREKAMVDAASRQEQEVIESWRSEALSLASELKSGKAAEGREHSRRLKAEKAMAEDASRFARERAAERAELKAVEGELEAMQKQ
ncbi:unnamed protein product [Polarella glacialis]|uniref:Uncharacterized protein n=1 Tax=Polarella glacialis TaxID=89957 RepID=A0A813JND4_POLGL|nr:unnamed protein product [Polarella glacialis]